MRLRRVALGHPQRQRAPAAAELEHALAVDQAGALAGRLQRGRLGLRRASPRGRARSSCCTCGAGRARRRRTRPAARSAARSPSPGSGAIGATRIASTKASASAARRGGVAVVQLGEARLEQSLDAEADDAIGHAALLDPVDGRGGAVRHGSVGGAPDDSCTDFVTAWITARVCSASAAFSHRPRPNAPPARAAAPWPDRDAALDAATTAPRTPSRAERQSRARSRARSAATSPRQRRGQRRLPA